MKYFISRIVENTPRFLEIDAIEYKQIEEARKNLLEALFLEEKLDFVIENYYEYETELLDIASRMMVFHNEDYFSRSQDRNIISRRVANLLSACRMYLDQSVHHIGNIYGKDSKEIEIIKAQKSFHYDQSLAYRVMEALRNYVQHRGFPIQSVQFSYRRVDKVDDIQVLHTVAPLIKISVLGDDKKFKRSVLKELKSTKNDDEFDIRPFIRDYVECIGTIHERTRELIGSGLIGWEELLENASRKFQEEFDLDDALASFTIIAKDEDHWQERKGVYREVIVERRKTFEKKNRSFNNLHKAYVSNEVRRKDA